MRSSLFVLLLLSFADAAADARTLANDPSQSDIEAVYLFDFSKFVRWPAGAADAPLQLCVAASPPFANGLQSLVANEHVNGQALAVRRILRPGDADGCSILFIDSSEKDHEGELLAATAGKSMLTVSDLPDFLDRGGMIQFLLIANRVRFSVNLDAVNRGNLSVSSELLKVAVSVNGKPAGGGQ
jgi:hypothetical protein